MEQFERSFLEVLKRRLDDKEVAKVMGPEIATKVEEGWRELLRPVVEYITETRRPGGP